MAQQTTTSDLSRFAIAALKTYWGFLDRLTGTQTGAIRVTIKVVITLFVLCLPIAYLKGEPQTTAAKAPEPAAVAATPTPTPSQYQQAIDFAMAAANATQTAKTPAELSKVVESWGNAIAMLKQVPADDPHHGVAQQKIGEYQKNLAYAQQRLEAATPPATAPVPASQPPMSSQSVGSDFNRFVQVIRNADPDKAVVTDMATSNIDGEVVLQVSNEWFYTPKQVRFQAAQNFWKIWASIHSPSDPDKARIKLVDRNGNRVGGSGWLAGSLIDVDN